MRTIKFRGQRIDNKEFVFGDLRHSFEGVHIVSSGDYFKPSNDEHPTLIDIDPKTIGQFTGLTDKNGKEIYEGAVVKERYYPIGSKKGVEYYMIGIIVWHVTGWGLKQEIKGINILNSDDAFPWEKETKEKCVAITAADDLVTTRIYPKELEVIGNIHQNPELL